MNIWIGITVKGATSHSKLRKGGWALIGAGGRNAMKVSAPIVIGRDHLDCGSVAPPNRETEKMIDGSDAIADWPILNALLNAVGGASWVSVHHGGGVGRHRDVRPDRADLAVLDQHVGAGEVADLAVEGEHDAALEQDAPLSHHAGEIGIARALGVRPARQYLRRRDACRERRARCQQRAAGRGANRGCVRIATA